MEHKLNIHELEIGFGKSAQRRYILFKGISVHADKGELVALVGKNGIGKSTFLRTLVHIQKSISGTIEWKGELLNKITRQQRSHTLAFVSTQPVTAGNLSVEQLVKLGRIPHTSWLDKHSDRDKEIVDYAIHTVQLETIRKKNLNEISDGERQRVMIARAIAQDTDILILDEPTAYLDLPNRVEILNLLKSLAHTKGKIVIFSTHDLNLIYREVDKIWMMAGSRFLQGSPEDMILNNEFNLMFSETPIRLNRKDGHFTFPKKLDKQIILKADGDLFLWTKNALERKGYEVLSKAEGPVRIEAVNMNDQFEWRIYEGNQKQLFHSIYEMLIALSKGN